MIDHFGLQAADPAAAAQFYTTVFAPIGLREALRFDTPAGPVVGLAGPDGNPSLWFSPVVGAGPGHEAHVALAAGSREQVDAVHAAALAAGVEVLHAPKEWPEYHPGYYAVFLRDPAGNNAEAVTHR